MIYENVELHNVEETPPMRGGGVRLQRVPESVREALNDGAKMRVRQPDGCEIRFVADGPVRVTLSSLGSTEAVVFFGTFEGRISHTVGREETVLDIEPTDRLKNLAEGYVRDLPFSPRVVRVLLGGRDRDNRDSVVFHGVEGKKVRPPEPAELPSFRYLAYGTSITHGFDAHAPHLTYPAIAGRLLGADVINLGLGGAAHCEPELTDYIAGRDDWDIASLALSVNMHDFPMGVFRERVSYMVNTVAGADTSRPVACITLYPYFRDAGIDLPESENSESGKPGPEEFRAALRDIVEDCPHANVVLIEGPELLQGFGGLTADLIHPGDYGMMEIGHNLADRLRRLLG